MTSTKTRMRLRKKRKIGSRLTAAPFFLFILLFPSAMTAERDKAKAKKTQTYSVVAGTVFRPPGFVLPGAEVTLKPEQGKGRQTMISNSRGEFAFRVPPVFARYTVSVKANGFQADEKSAEVGIEQRLDLSFELKPKE